MTKGFVPADCFSALDWTVRLADGGGTLSCGPYRGRFKVNRMGVIQISWQHGPEPRDHARIEKATRKAVEREMSGHFR
ncbi:hypothetical protein [Inquilinus sp. OTU3971]|uniref:hypothetical protein n=1 Tax=Inquilinus sp. OTU3971 TaxID=3043855 RepID=UPI00313CDB3B